MIDISDSEEEEEEKGGAASSSKKASTSNNPAKQKRIKQIDDLNKSVTTDEERETPDEKANIFEADNVVVSLHSLKNQPSALLFWNIKTGEQINKVLTQHQDEVVGLVRNKDFIVATASKDKEVHFYC